MDYLYLPSKIIPDKQDFYRSGIVEASKIRNLISVCQRIFITNTNHIDLFLLGDKDVYRIDVWDPKSLMSQLYYLPKEYRLDIYDGSDSSSPLFMWKSKRCVYKNLPQILNSLEAEKLLLPLVSVI